MGTLAKGPSLDSDTQRTSIRFVDEEDEVLVSGIRALG